MSKELGAWLRQERERLGLTRPELARRLIEAGRGRGDNMPGTDSMCHNIYRWERGADGLSERYKLAYCRVLGISLAQFGPGRQDELEPATPGGALMAISPGTPAPSTAITASVRSPGPSGQALLLNAAVAYRGMRAPDPGDCNAEREVLMAAHEGSEQAGRAEERGIGDTTLEQFRADVIRLSAEFQTGEPLPLFLEMRRVRGRMHDVLDRRLWPRDATELYLLLGALNNLMAMASYDLGYPQAAEELLRAGWVYAVAIDHHPLMASLRQGLASILARTQPQRCRQYADDGLRHLSAGPVGAALFLYRARAAARLGDAEIARQSVADANEARERSQHDDVLDMGGEFVLSRATHHCYAGWAFLELPEAADEAALELERAAQMYMRGPEPGETHGFGLEAIARINLATARLRSGALDAATDALAPVLSLPIQKRILDLVQQLSAVRAELAAPIFKAAASARTLDEQIEDFGRDTIVSSLQSLPGAAG